jgi:hypothetical protein
MPLTGSRPAHFSPEALGIKLYTISGPIGPSRQLEEWPYILVGNRK